jgi:HPt (histidine-containing phosphotransfer) domain-containing protein
MAPIRLDAERVAELKVFEADELSEIANETIASLDELSTQLTQAISSGDLRGAASLAHAARGEAMVVGAMELVGELQSFEDALHDGDPARALEGADRIGELWPDTRAAIEQLGAG